MRPQVGQGHGRFLRIRAVEAFVEIGQVRPFLGQRGNQLPHLQAPVAEVGVPHDLVAEKSHDALQAFADHGGTQVADMHFLGDIGARRSR